jgi:hypothetical protein
MNSWCTVSLYSHFFSSIWRMQKIWSVVDLLSQNPHWWSPIISSMYGLNLERRIFDKILYDVDNSRSRSYFMTDSQSVCLGIEYPCGTCGQILFPVGMLLSEICGLVFVGCLEDGSAICNVITQWSESLRTRNHIWLSHLRLPQPGGPGYRIYIPQEQGGPVISLGTRFW